MIYRGYYNNTGQQYFPKHYGHRAWQYFSESVEDAAIEDLFWRKVQVSPTFAWEVVRTVWADANRGKWDAFIRPNLYVSLLPESCGAYTLGGWCGLYPLRGDVSDTKRIEQGAQSSDRSGYYLGALVAKHMGWLPENVVPNLLHAMGQRLEVSDRFRFNFKANHRPLPLEKELTAVEINDIVKMAYPVRYGMSSWTVYWYRDEDGRVRHGVVYLYDSIGNTYKLAVTGWAPAQTDDGKIVYDLLNIAPPYQLYRLDDLVRYRVAWYVLICESEATVEELRMEHAWILRYWPITTYSAINGTDWSKLKGRVPIIFPEASASGCHKAFQLYAALEKEGFKPLLVKRQKSTGPCSQEFLFDVGQLHTTNGKCSLAEFAEHSLRVFGVQPPEGVLPKAVALADLPEPAVPPEKLIDGLLDTGEMMMIYAWRGIGKSLFAMLLAICFEAGKSALNGRICPSRKYKVRVLDGEMSSCSLKERARRLCKGHALPIEVADKLNIRSIVAERKSLELETDAGFADLKPDMEAADIIIVDSIFKFFPSSMRHEFSATEKLQKFIDWARENHKTLIVIDHEGKGGATSYGSMGKEISLDSVLRLHRTKKNAIQATVQKVRNHAQPMEAYLEMRIEADEKGERIAFLVGDEHKADTADGGDSSSLGGEAGSPASSAERAPGLDEAIIQYIGEHPGAAQRKVAAALKAEGYGCMSNIQGRTKTLSEAGKLPGWHNRPESHKVTEQSVPEDGEK